MPAIYILLIVLIGGWVLLVATFIWTYVRERTISEIIRSARSRP
jgi:hypothetical protein